MEARAQGYRSVFGDSSTYWRVLFTGLVDHAGTVVIDGDTVMGGISWKKVRLTTCCNTPVSFLREDTPSGRVWARPKLSSNDTVERLVVDMSLNVGDTFRLHYSQTYGVKMCLVDSVYHLNGRKYIVFNKTVFGNVERFKMIEGVGTNMGLLMSSKVFAAGEDYLLCAFKDSIQSYSNLYFNGNCTPQIIGQSIKEHSSETTVQLMPNPVCDWLQIKSAEAFKGAQLAIYNALGQLTLAAILSQEKSVRINVEQLPLGFYTVVVMRQGELPFRTSFVKGGD